MKTLLKEGGLAGHISHVWAKLDFSFSDLFNILKSIHSNFKESLSPTEKFDGINLFVTKKNGIVSFARNKTHQKMGGLSISEFANYLSERDKTLKEEMLKACIVLQQKFSPILELEGQWLNCEIMSPLLQNVVPIDSFKIIIHQFLSQIEEKAFLQIKEELVNDDLVFVNEILDVPNIETIKERKQLFKLMKDYDLSSASSIHDFAELRKALRSGSSLDDQLYHNKAGLSSGSHRDLELLLSPIKKIFDDILLKVSESLGKSDDEFEGIVFSFNGEILKMTGTFSERNREKHSLNEKKTIVNEATVIFPGGFKPPHKGHLNVILEFLSGKKTEEKNIIVNKIMLVMSDSPRDGFGFEKAVKLWSLYLESYHLSDLVSILEIKTKKGYGPLQHTSDFVLGKGEEKPEPGKTYILATSGKDTGRYNFLSGYLTGEEGWNIIYNIESSPVPSINGQALSSSDMRRHISNKNKEKINEFLPRRIIDDPDLLDRCYDILFDDLHQIKINERSINKIINKKLSGLLPMVG